MQLAIGRLNISPEAFGELRLKYFFMMVQEYYQQRQEEFAFYGEMTRLQTTHLINIQLPRDKKLKPQQVWQFPWEETSEYIIESLKEMDRLEFEQNYRSFLGLE